jgi:hypothetical protein
MPGGGGIDLGRVDPHTVPVLPVGEDVALAVAGVIEDKLDGWKPPNL